MARGRPTKYRPEFADLAAAMCERGATDVEVADALGIHVRSLMRFKHDHEDFCQALSVAKAVADDRVERSLFARATGFAHDDWDVRLVGDKVVQTPVRRQIPPDTTACIFWLKNRRRGAWRDKIEQEHTGPDGGPILIQATPLDEKL